ncbi:MAG: hypothetical protein LBQ00_03955 [Syntrophobacterales bacterium]|jgi:hypothetical protein|nr:hypothetical protein [Syntrophobacterales bacterium]
MSIINLNEISLNVSRGIARIGEIYDENWLERSSLKAPEEVVKAIVSAGAKIDIFTFMQTLSEASPKYGYYMEWDNVAVIRLATFDEWWAGLPQATRKNVRRSAKRGVNTKVVEFNDELVKGIVNIYNETPVRQGRYFWHYGKDFDTVKRENATYLSKCDFIGAYLNDELIGFIKVVYVGQAAKIMQIISMVRHQDKRPTNALIAKTVEICEKRQMKYFTYGKYIYGKRTNTPIIEFKNRNGFKMIEIPRYYIPVSNRGRIVLKLRLHHGIAGLIPVKLNNYLIDVRTKWYERKMKGEEEGGNGN